LFVTFSKEIKNVHIRGWKYRDIPQKPDLWNAAGGYCRIPKAKNFPATNKKSANPLFMGFADWDYKKGLLLKPFFVSENLFSSS